MMSQLEVYRESKRVRARRRLFDKLAALCIAHDVVALVCNDSSASCAASSKCRRRVQWSIRPRSSSSTRYACDGHACAVLGESIA
jgi:hypothetical protein